jgi:hypothetical protein
MIDDDDDDFLTKDDCLTEIVYGNGPGHEGERYEEAMARFIELGGTFAELRAELDKAIAFMERALKQGEN